MEASQGKMKEEKSKRKTSKLQKANTRRSMEKNSSECLFSCLSSSLNMF